ncbi:hypothetical protein MtrunA17_Chr3g0107451 [Medicago truncatula]|uniref:Uncharacterized protein n=1 Tax=Medicago truncatula TaxID=3880 RepID=A0A396IT41_MEDTR|nr:hypothetical protein MtrunA17_Chr3g0107451 [Medicago truncatula]
MVRKKRTDGPDGAKSSDDQSNSPPPHQVTEVYRGVGHQEGENDGYGGWDDEFASDPIQIQTFLVGR